MPDNYVYVSVIKEKFNLKQVAGTELSLQRKILIPELNRPGLELTGFYDVTESKRTVIIGHKEIAYLENLDEEVQRSRFDFLTSSKTPCIIIASGHKIPSTLFQVAEKKDFPVFLSPRITSHLFMDVNVYLNMLLGPVTSKHGVLLNVFGKGVLITGESGVGKSEVALELINNGHALIADDRINIRKVNDSLIGEAPELLRGYLEIRGIGIIDVVQMFGSGSYQEKHIIDCIIELDKFSIQKDYLRVGDDFDSEELILGVSVKHLSFPVKEGRNMAVLIEAAVLNFSLKQFGFNSAKNFDERVVKFIKNKKEKK